MHLHDDQSLFCGDRSTCSSPQRHDSKKCLFDPLVHLQTIYIEDICFFEVNTKYISSSELKTSKFSRVRNSRDEIYLVFTENKQIFFLFYTIHGHFPIHKAGGEMQKPNIFENTNNFGTTLFLTF